MESRVEKLFKAFVDGGVDSLPKPQSRMEEFIIAMLTAEVETNLPTPQSRVEALLKYAADTGVGGGVDPGDAPLYEGAHEVTPSAVEAIILRTAQTFVGSNIKIEKISYSEVSNESGGTTVTIGG